MSGIRTLNVSGDRYFQLPYDYDGPKTYKLQIRTKYKKRNHRTGTAKTQYNFNLYVDGIHPDNLLANTWFKKITGQIQLNCWN